MVVCLLLWTSLLVTSCQTAPKKSYTFRDIKAGVFVGNVYIKDRVKNKSFVVNYKSQLNQYTNLRLDVTAPFIGHLASVTVNNQNLQYMIPRQRKFYSGSINAPDIQKHLPFPVNPEILSHVFWGTAINDKAWECTDDTKIKSACVRREAGVKIVWKKEPDLMPSVITVNHRRGSVKFLVKDFTPGLSQKQMNRFIMAKPNW